MNTLANWMATYAMHSAISIALVWIGCRFVSSASLRDTLWKAALLGGFLTATAQIALPPERVLPAAAPKRVTVAMPIAPVAMAPAVRTTEPLPASPKRPDATTLIAAAYAAIALALCFRIAIGRKRFLDAIADRKELVTGPERELVDRLAAAARITRPVLLSESRSLASPVAMTSWQIVLPTGLFARLNAAQQETIIAHELGHLVRRDPLWLTLAEFVKAVFFFQPLNWIVPARLRETAEFLCDDAAVLQTGNRKALAETLAELATHISAPTPSIAAMAEGRSRLIERVTRVLAAGPALPVPAGIRLGLAVALIAIVAVAAPGAVTRTPLAVLARSAAAKSTPVPDATVFNDVSDMSLGQTFEGPEGRTRVRLEAHQVRIAHDGSSVIFHTDDGFYRVHQTSPAGTKRVEIVPGPGRAPRYRYTVDGAEQPWNDYAMRIALSGFLADDAYRDFGREVSVTERGGQPQSSWDAHVSFTGHRDGVPLQIRISIEGLKYDKRTYASRFEEGGSIVAYEKLGDQERQAEITNEGITWRGDWGGVSDADRRTWLRSMLRDRVGGDERLIDAVAGD